MNYNFIIIKKLLLACDLKNILTKYLSICVLGLTNFYNTKIFKNFNIQSKIYLEITKSIFK